MRRRKILTPTPQPATPAEAPQPAYKRRLVRPGLGDPRVTQFREPEARKRVELAISQNPALEATAFTHRPWFRGGGLTAEEAVRVGQGKTIRVAGIRYTKSHRAVCDDCTYTDHARLTVEGWDQPIFQGETGLFDCSECGIEFTGEIELWP